MTAGAVEAEFPVVYVVRTVAIATAAPKLAQRSQRLPMTVGTGNRGMRAVEQKICLAVVVELPLVPVHGVVTVGTIVAVATLMRIFLEMTVHACRRRIAEYAGLVAGSAILAGVYAQQWKARQIVVEEYIVFPGVLVMAVSALRALFTLMRIIFGMAVIASRLQCHIENRLYVTGLALSRLMSAIECVIGIDIVVEYALRPGLA